LNGEMWPEVSCSSADGPIKWLAKKNQGWFPLLFCWSINVNQMFINAMSFCQQE
jgi:hypothetical protein